MAFVLKIIQQALRRPAGAQFYERAFQVNPFEYYKRHSKGTAYTTEDEFNSAIVDALVFAGVEVIAVTGYYRVSTGTKLAAAARARGLVAFNGFEAVTKDGAHVLIQYGGRKPRFLVRDLNLAIFRDVNVACPFRFTNDR